MKTSDTRSSAAMTGPLLVWLLIQLLALLLAAARVPLSAGFANPPESLALHEMIIAQIAVSGMLFPFLLRDWRTAMVIACMSLPFTLLAGFLASRPFQQTAIIAAYVVCWIFCLASWRAALPARLHLTGVAVANILALGGVTLWYLRNEFRPWTETMDWKTDALLGPIIGAMSLLGAKPPGIRPWLILVTLAAGSAAAWIVSSGGKWKRCGANSR